jgi:hypothetical protein
VENVHILQWDDGAGNEVVSLDDAKKLTPVPMKDAKLGQVVITYRDDDPFTEWGWHPDCTDYYDDEIGPITLVKQRWLLVDESTVTVGKSGFVTDHPYVPIAGHPDDPECAECGEHKYLHEIQP